METDQDLIDQLNSIDAVSLSSSFDNEVLSFLAKIDKKYSKKEPQWEYFHGRIAGMSSEKIVELERYIENYEELEVRKDIAFQVFFALTKVHIQKEDSEELQRLEEEYGDKFEEYDLFPHILSQSCRVRYNIGNERTLNLAYEAIENFESHPGALHNLAQIFVDRISSGINFASNPSLPDSPNEQRRYAEHCVRDAIEHESEYGIYHATLGRILGEMDEFSEARNSIQQAINLEERDKKDSPIRIAHYNRYLTEVDILEQRNEFDKTKSKIEGAEEKVEEFQTRILEFLGFFAALLTVAVASISISANFPFSDAARLILVLVGGMLIAFSGLGTVLPRQESSSYNTIGIGFMGLLLVILGLISPFMVDYLQTL